MSEESLRAAVQQCWQVLEVEAATGERRIRVADLPVTTERGPLRAGIDAEGHRHVLVPVPSQRKVRPGMDGPVLQLRKRPLEDADSYQHYADLSCLRVDMNDLFTKLCADVLATTEAHPGEPLKALYRVLDRWKDLFRAQGAPLGPEQLAGLFGELAVLTRLLEQDPSAHRLWRGPAGHCHDFVAGSRAVEVKTGTDDEQRRPRIHGLDQLEPPEKAGSLLLAWFRLRRTGNADHGLSVVEAVAAAMSLCDDETALRELLATVGYRPAEESHYAEVRFQTVEERWYEVDADFPSLTGHALREAGVSVQVSDVEYTIDLSGGFPVPLPTEAVAGVLEEMIEESA
jgi:hypothetical protein